MKRDSQRLAVLLALALLMGAGPAGARAGEHPKIDLRKGWQKLFNGKDLTGWETRDSDGRKLLLWMCGLGLVVHLPLLTGLVQRLWAEEHYQHVPLVLAAAVGLAYFRWPEVVATATWSWPGVLLLAVQLPLMLLAFAGNSHWLGAVSLVLYLAAACLLFGGWTTTRLLAGPLFLLLLWEELDCQEAVLHW